MIVFCGVGGVEPQSETVWLQADRYHVPRIAFINKMDRVGADFYRVVAMMDEKFKMKALPIQLPIGSEENFRGMVDVIENKAYVWSGEELGASYEEVAVPEDLKAETKKYHDLLVDTLTHYDEHLLTKYMNGEPLRPRVTSGGLAPCDDCPASGAGAVRDGVQEQRRPDGPRRGH